MTGSVGSVAANGADVEIADTVSGTRAVTCAVAVADPPTGTFPKSVAEPYSTAPVGRPKASR